MTENSTESIHQREEENTPASNLVTSEATNKDTPASNLVTSEATEKDTVPCNTVINQVTDKDTVTCNSATIEATDKDTNEETDSARDTRSSSALSNTIPLGQGVQCIFLFLS